MSVALAPVAGRPEAAFGGAAPRSHSLVGMVIAPVYPGLGGCGPGGRPSHGQGRCCRRREEELRGVLPPRRA